MRLAQQLKAKKMEDLIAIESGINVKKFEATSITFRDYALEVASRYKVKNTYRAFTTAAKRIPEKFLLASVDRNAISKIIRDSWGECSQNSQNSNGTFLKLAVRKAFKEGLLAQLPDLSGVVPSQGMDARDVVAVQKDVVGTVQGHFVHGSKLALRGLRAEITPN